MREIKFRAWDKDLEKMFDVFTMDGQRNQETNETILMQYTGLKDKNGREIYEGDMYRYTTTHDTYNPEVGHTTFEVKNVLTVTYENGAFYHGIELLSDVLEYNDTIEYVGNIYENPELLEAK